MNEPMLRMMMDAIDDDLLEEAQRPLPARRPALRWGTLAACLCITAALLLAQPWRADRANSAAGTDNAAPSTAPAESSASPSAPRWPCRRTRCASRATIPAPTMPAP